MTNEMDFSNYTIDELVELRDKIIRKELEMNRGPSGWQAATLNHKTMASKAKSAPISLEI